MADLILTPIADVLALSSFRDEVSIELLGGDTARHFAVSLDLDPPPYEPPVWLDAGTGELGLLSETIEALSRGEPGAVAALAAQVIHAIGEGPAFPELTEQLLEEAICETLAQLHIDDFVRAFGGRPRPQGPLFRATEDGCDLEVSRVTAASVSVERFGRLAAWFEGLDGTDAPEDYVDAALKWAVRLKVTPGEARFLIMAREAAALNGDHDDVGAVDFLEDYLRGYMRQLRRSRAAFAGLDYANERAWADDAQHPPVLKTRSSADLWRVELEKLEGVILRPGPPRGAISAALAAFSDPHVAFAARRNTAALELLWHARAVEAARAPRLATSKLDDAGPRRFGVQWTEASD